MTPKRSERDKQETNLFQSRLDQILSKSHPLYRLSNEINWSMFEEEFGKLYTENNGRPGLPTRLLVGLHYLKYTYNYSDEGVVEQFLENPYWQYFCGFEYFQHEFPCNPSSLTRWRKRIGEEKFEIFLKETISLGLRKDIINKNEFHKVNADTTVQEKGIAYPTDSRLYFKAIRRMIGIAKKYGIELRQSYKRKSKIAFVSQSRYARAGQFKRAVKESKKLRIYMGRIMRDIGRKNRNPNVEIKEILEKANLLFHQQRGDKNKLYSIHAPEVECIQKGKVHKKFEFGCKVSFVTTSKNNWIVSSRAFHGNPYDGHTLKESIDQMERVCNTKPKDIYVDMGYKGKIPLPENIEIHLSRSKKKKITPWERMWLRRRNAIEPIFSHAKHYHRMDRNHLLGKAGDKINAILSAVGCNFRKLILAFYFSLKLFSEKYLFVINNLLDFTKIGVLQG
jgi:transposase, IS5 family